MLTEYIELILLRATVEEGKTCHEAAALITAFLLSPRGAEVMEAHRAAVGVQTP